MATFLIFLISSVKLQFCSNFVYPNFFVLPENDGKASCLLYRTYINLILYLVSTGDDFQISSLLAVNARDGVVAQSFPLFSSVFIL